MALADTIVVLTPDSFLLRVGQSLDELESVRVESRRASGEPVPGVGDMLAIEDMSIAQARAAAAIRSPAPERASTTRETGPDPVKPV